MNPNKKSYSFIDTGAQIEIRQEIGEAIDHLSAGVYRLHVEDTPFGSKISLNKAGKNFVVSDTRYGDHNDIVDMIVSDYDRVGVPVGVLAVGMKGSGKTMLCQDISNRLIAKGLPVIIIDSTISPHIVRAIAELVGPCVFFFDEFGKVYREQEVREGFLGIFGDPKLVGRMFLLTGNYKSEFSDFVLDRPTRIKYRIDLSSIPLTSLEDFYNRHKIEISKLCWLTPIRNELSYDLLNSLLGPLRSSKTYEEFVRSTRFHNVPAPMMYMFLINGLGGAKLKETDKDGKPLVYPVEDIEFSMEGREIVARFPGIDGEQKEHRITFLSEFGTIAFPDYCPIVVPGHFRATIDIRYAHVPLYLLSDLGPFCKVISPSNAVGEIPSVRADTRDSDYFDERTHMRGQPAVRDSGANGRAVTTHDPDAMLERALPLGFISSKNGPRGGANLQ